MASSLDMWSEDPGELGRSIEACDGLIGVRGYSYFKGRKIVWARWDTCEWNTGRAKKNPKT